LGYIKKFRGIWEGNFLNDAETKFRKCNFTQKKIIAKIFLEKILKN